VGHVDTDYFVLPVFRSKKSLFSPMAVLRQFMISSWKSVPAAKNAYQKYCDVHPKLAHAAWLWRDRVLVQKDGTRCYAQSPRLNLAPAPKV
jgi:hypothetical protein